MKLFLISFILLLVPLALAKPSPVLDKLQSYAKLLFDAGYTKMLSINADSVDYFYKGSNFTFLAKKNITGHSEAMYLKRDLIKESGGFAIVAYQGEPSKGDSVCMGESDEELKHLIVGCRENIIIRKLSDVERKELLQYQRQQKVLGDPFVVQYANYYSRVTEIRSAESDWIGFEDKIRSPSYQTFDFYARINPGEQTNEIGLSDSDRIVSFALLGRKPGDAKGCRTHTDQIPFVGHCQGNFLIGTYSYGDDH